MEVKAGYVPQNFVREKVKSEPGKKNIINYRNVSNIAKIQTIEDFREDKMRGREFTTTAYDSFGNKLFESIMEAGR